jgi:hypothetical protein
MAGAKKPPASSVEEAVERALTDAERDDVEDVVVADPSDLEQVAKEAAQEAASLDPQKVPTKKRAEVAESLAAREAALAAAMKAREKGEPTDFEHRVPTVKGTPLK